MAAAALEVAHHWLDGRVETVTIRTSGDKVQDRPLSEIGGKALWTKELDAALLDNALAIHRNSGLAILSRPELPEDSPSPIRGLEARPAIEYQ